MAIPCLRLCCVGAMEEEGEGLLGVKLEEQDKLAEDLLPGLVSSAFLKGRSLVAHQLESFNEFCDRLPALFQEAEELRVDHEEQQKYAMLKIVRVSMKKPEIKERGEEEARPLFPTEARLRNISYSASMTADISLKVFSSSGNELVSEDEFKDVVLGELPCMVKSKLCNASDQPGNKNRTVFDDGGYFIIQGLEKVVLSQEDRFLNRCIVSKGKGEWKCYMGCPTRGFSTAKNIVTVKLKDDGGLYLVLPGAEEIPIVIALRSLGVTRDRALLQVLQASADDDDGEMGEFLMPSFREAEAEMLNFKVEDDFKNQADNLKYVESKMRGGVEAKTLFETRLFPGSEDKAHLLGYLAYYLAAVYLGRRPEVDSLKNKRVDCVGNVFMAQLKASMKRYFKELSKQIKMCLSRDRAIRLNLVSNSLLSKDFNGAFRSGNWAGFQGSKVVIPLQRTNHTQTLSHLRHVRAQSAYTGKVGSSTYPNKSHFGRFCPVETPEGEECGFMKTMAIFAVISSHRASDSVLDVLERCGMRRLTSCSQECQKIFLNGLWIGVIDGEGALDDHLRSLRRGGFIHPEVEVARNKFQEIHIFTDAGRVLRPIFVVNDDGRLLATSRELLHMADPEKVTYLLREGIVELLGPEEEEGRLIASSLKELDGDNTHLELHPAAVLSLGASAIPFANHNQSLRVTHQSQKHGKQAIGYYSCYPGVRCQKSYHELFYPQKVLVSTRISQLLDRSELMNGQNCVVAVACYTGYNQEDSIMLNQASLDRGLFKSRHVTTHGYSIDPMKSEEQFRKPSSADIGGFGYQSGVLDKLDSDGFPQVDASLEAGSVVIGKVIPQPSAGRLRDTSVVLRTFEGGMVDKVVLASGGNGSQIGRVQLVKSRSPQVGDKFSSLHGQKGVVGVCIGQEDLFFTHQGIAPDLLINPHAFPTRQTLGQLLEAVAGKAAACGHRTSSTPFDEDSPEQLADTLHKAGYQRWGSERVLNGYYGTPIRAQIFVGVNYYQQLVHMADDRIKWRRIGKTHPLTRQPIGDRQRYGGIKFSEMERDCLVAHGAVAAVQERMFRLSDPHQVFVCKLCQRMANIGRSKLPLCSFCDGRNPTFVTVELPYSCKLLIQELNSMCIDIRLMTEDV